MNLTLHLIRKDLHRLRLPLALWTLVFFVRIVLCGSVLSPGTVEVPDLTHRGMLVVVVTVVAALVNYLMVAALVFEDPVAGTRMFWASRPISGRRLLVAKVLVAALVFVLWPVLINGVWGLAQGIAFTSLVPSLLQTALLHTSFTLPAMLLAALTGHSARFLIWTLVGLVGVPVILVSSQATWTRDLPATVGRTRDSITILAVLLGGAAAIISQYTTRQTVRSVTMTAVALVLAIAVRYGWHWDFIPKGPAPMAASELFAGAKPVMVRQAWVEVANDQIWLNVLLTEDTTDRPMIERGGKVEVELAWGEDTVRRSGMVTMASPREVAVNRLLQLPERPERDAETVQYLASLRRESEEESDSDRILPARDFAGRDRVRFRIDEQLAARIAKEAPRCRLVLQARELHPKLIGEIPFVPGASLKAEGVHVSVQSNSLQVRQTPRDKRPSRLGALTFSQPSSPKAGRLIVRVIDREGSRVIARNDLNYGSLVSGLGLPSSYGISWLNFYAPWVWRTDHWVQTPGWDKQLTLAAIVLQPGGTFRQVLVVERLVLTR